jgi:sulfur-carrier protein adenylyltransferase/sulfurtransferase
VEADGRRLRERAREGAEPRERALRGVLAVAADRSRHAGVHVSGGEGGGGGELPLGRDGPAEPLQREAVEELCADVVAARSPLERAQLRGRRHRGETLRRRELGDEERQPRWRVRMQEVVGANRRRRVGVHPDGRPPGTERLLVAARPEARQADVQLHDAAVWEAAAEPLEPGEAAVGPRGERPSDLRLSRFEGRERPRRRSKTLAGDPEPAALLRVFAPGVEVLAAPERLGLRVRPDAEVEHERRVPRPYVGDSRALIVVFRAQHRYAERDDDGEQSGSGDEGDDPSPGAHRPATIAAHRVGAAILRSVKPAVRQIDVEQARERLDAPEPPVLVDVREQNEWNQGHIPGAVLIPLGEVETRIAEAAPDRSRPVLLYCASGSRSARAAQTLTELGYEDAVNVAGGFNKWAERGYASELESSLEPEQVARYSRHLLIPEIDEPGQVRLLESRVLLVGAGGLGSPAALYLAAAGVGTLGIVDADVVDASNLQRQVLHSTDTLGVPKVRSATDAIRALNPDVDVVGYEERLTSESIDRILDDGWEVIVDGADNFPTRYLVNDASVWSGLPVVHGSIYRFEGQVTVFKPKPTARGGRHQDVRALPVRPSALTGRAVDGDRNAEEPGPCYRCLFPQPPPPELAPSCAEGGVLGVLPGVVGSLQANEALKLVLGIGEPLVGRLLLYDALEPSFTEVQVRRDPACPVCGDEPTIREYVDYVEFCAG